MSPDRPRLAPNFLRQQKFRGTRTPAGMRLLQPHHPNDGEDNAISTAKTCADPAGFVHGASKPRTFRRGVFPLATLAALTVVRGGASAKQLELESPRILCIQAIQTAIIDRTQDLFQHPYLDDVHQVSSRDSSMQAFGRLGATGRINLSRFFVVRLEYGL